MDVEIEVLDEHLQPLQVPAWPGGMKAWVPEMPKVADPAQPHRLIFSNQYLNTFGFNISSNDTIADLRIALEKAMPHFRKGLAVGLNIKEFMFLKEVLPETTPLNEIGVKVVNTRGSHFSLVGHQDCLQVVVRVVARIFTEDKGKLLAVALDDFDRDTVSCRDILHKLDAFPEVMPSMRLVREYPTTRPFLCKQDTRLYGFAGKRDRGLWAEPPHKGPLQTCALTAPPALTLRLMHSDDAARLEKEEDWWSLLDSQPGWVGHQETYCGEKEPVTVMLKSPQVPTWVNVTLSETPKPIKVHTLWKKKVHAGGGSGLRVAVKPHEGLFPNQATFHDDATISACEDGMYLPVPKELDQQGVAYAKYELCTSFGTGFIKSGADGHALRATYKVMVEDKATTRLLVSAPDTHVQQDPNGPVPEHVYEGTLATGLTQCQYFRGVHYYQWPDEKEVPDGRKLPFCLFQLTPNNRIPEIVTSPMGKRYAGLKNRSYTILAPATGAAIVGYQDAFTPSAEFFSKLLGAEPRLVLADLAFLDEGVHVNVCAFILWHIVSLDELKMPLLEANRIKSLAQCVIRAQCEDDVQQHLEEYGKLYGVGPDPATISPKKSGFVPGALDKLPSSSEALARATSVSGAAAEGTEQKRGQKAADERQHVGRAATLAGCKPKVPPPVKPRTRRVGAVDEATGKPEGAGSGKGSGGDGSKQTTGEQQPRGGEERVAAQAERQSGTCDAQRSEEEESEYGRTKDTSRRATKRKQQRVGDGGMASSGSAGKDRKGKKDCVIS